MAMIAIDIKLRIHNASDQVLKTMLHETQEQLKLHRRAANNTHQSKEQREKSAFRAAYRQELESAILAEQKARAEAEHLAITSAIYEPPKQKTSNAAYKELLALEEDLDRAQSNEAEFRIKAKQSKSDADRIRNNDLADYWLKRTENAISRINEFVVMHKNDLDKPWLTDDPGRAPGATLH